MLLPRGRYDGFLAVLALRIDSGRFCFHSVTPELRSAQKPKGEISIPPANESDSSVLLVAFLASPWRTRHPPRIFRGECARSKKTKLPDRPGTMTARSRARRGGGGGEVKETVERGDGERGETERE